MVFSNWESVWARVRVDYGMGFSKGSWKGFGKFLSKVSDKGLFKDKTLLYEILTWVIYDCTDVV